MPKTTWIEVNADLMAKHYVDTINGQPNGWGQYCSPIYGQSHYIMRRMAGLFGEDTTQRAIKKALGRGEYHVLD